MAIVGKGGINVSFDSEELIREVKRDIAEFGSNDVVAVWVKDYGGAKIITNYDFIVDDAPVAEEEMQEGEKIEKMTLGDLWIYLEKQNQIV